MKRVFELDFSSIDECLKLKQILKARKGRKIAKKED